jgi:hypothetical protein
VVNRFKRPFRDGSIHAVFEPLDFMFRMNGMPRAQGCAGAAMARLAALVPRRPRGRVDSDKPRAPLSRAQRLKRVFAVPQGTLSRCCASIHLVDIESCPECGGRLRVIACIEEPALIREILGHVRKREELTGIEARGPPGRGAESLQLM